jgi:hypothetical protein
MASIFFLRFVRALQSLAFRIISLAVISSCILSSIWPTWVMGRLAPAGPVQARAGNPQPVALNRSRPATEHAFAPLPVLTWPEPRLGERPVDGLLTGATALTSPPALFVENQGQFDAGAQFVVRGMGGTIHLAQDAIWATVLEPGDALEQLPESAAGANGTAQPELMATPPSTPIAIVPAEATTTPQPTPTAPLPAEATATPTATPAATLPTEPAAVLQLTVTASLPTEAVDLFQLTPTSPLPSEPAADSPAISLQPSPEPTPQVDPQKQKLRKGVNLRISFVGAQSQPQVVGFDPVDTRLSYFRGNDPNQWKAAVPVWRGVRYVDLYPGIDLEMTSQGGQWAWRLVVRDPDNPAAVSQLAQVRLQVKGAEALSLEDAPAATTARPAPGGRLRLTTAVGDFTLPLLEVVGADLAAGVRRSQGTAGPTIEGDEVTAPFAQPAASGRLGGGKPLYRLAVPAPLSANEAASTNPTDLLYSTFLGGNSDDDGTSLAVDNTGAAYIAGQVSSAEFPTTYGAFDTTYDGGPSDVIVVKLSRDGRTLVYSTFIGGNSTDCHWGCAIAVDASGAAYVAGTTVSSDFPTTAGGIISIIRGTAQPRGAHLAYL